MEICSALPESAEILLCESGEEMTDKEANDMRLIANEIMRRLYEAGQLKQIVVLHNYANAILERAEESRS